MKKAQIHMMETMAVLFVFFILIALALVVYFNIAKSSLEDKKEEFSELSRVQVDQISSSLPEFQCSTLGIIDEKCYDVLKMQQADVLTVGDYFDLLGFSTITVTQVFPSEDSWILYNNSLDDFESKRQSFFPVSLYDAKEQRNGFGYVQVEVFS